MSQPALPHFDSEVAEAHELPPHSMNIPLKGVKEGMNQFRLTLVVSPEGKVVQAKAEAAPDLMKFWPDMEGEVDGWRFTPFEVDGKPVTAEVEEYVNAVPPERLPTHHVPAPALRPDSAIAIELVRSGCLGTCPSYRVKMTTKGIEFEGDAFVVAEGRHKAAVDAPVVRELAKGMEEADFYSMDAVYRANVTDNPTYVLRISVDGQSHEVMDYAGAWVGMPEVIAELEDAVDRAARTDRWVQGKEGLVAALKAEGFDFKSLSAQLMVKRAAWKGQTETVREFLAAGVPLKPMPIPAQTPVMFTMDDEGWLASAATHAETLEVFLRAGASRSDPADKDVALYVAAAAGNVEAAKELIAYGANPRAEFGEDVGSGDKSGTQAGGGLGSVLIGAAHSGNPEMVREILRYHPNLEARDRKGETAMFAAADWRAGDQDGARVECVRLLAAAGANVNARDKDGNTSLHETFLTDVEEELLKQGADVNARNDDGETPIFTTVDNDAFPLFLRYGADLSIRNKAGQTVVEAAKSQGRDRQEALRKAIAGMGKK